MISRRNKIVALVLCIFTGFFGGHRFYVGKLGTGIIYLFTMGLFGFGWIMDLLLIITGTFKDNLGLELK
ncbi:NINE protein [Candidatus Epulonipiscium fishelsonii]|uniref:NINE protein n=1 Tax=Candidatus Epulonipiscium fishelsonii TaxID=77094 RepID=A0ACC8XBN9_9FIRM|nr:NINE protein [Epulopiscium sp. SCG-B05WGA-EpuloA1]ONI39875.1 NINE protein [Epulopiscium sp. SCG-B11WGA-EpuloA1]